MPYPGHEPSLDDLQEMAEEAFAALPAQFRDLTGDIVFTVQDFPDREAVAGLGLKSGYDLLGLFHGAPLAAHEANRAGPNPTMIFLFRRPILQFWRREGGALPDIVRHVLIHEIGHHFGLSDDDMEAIEADED